MYAVATTNVNLLLGLRRIQERDLILAVFIDLVYE